MQMMLENSNVEEDDDDDGGEESDEDAVAGHRQLEENNGDSMACSPSVAEDDDDVSIKNVFDGTTPVASRGRAANDEHRRRGMGHGKNGPISASSPALNCKIAGDYFTKKTTKHLMITLDLLVNTVKVPNFGAHVNFELFSRRTCYHQNVSYRRMKKMKVVEYSKICKFGYVHFWFKKKNSCKEATDLARKASKFT
jgi:hypothetical protein